MMTIPALVIRRTFAAPPERVYTAWVTPDVAARFLGPGDVRASVPEMEVRVGGRYRVDMLRTDGETWSAVGEYREIVPNRRIVMTWRWLEDDPADELDTLLTLEFNPDGDGTEFILTHAQLASEASRERHQHGWTLMTEQLAGVLGEA